MQNRIESIDIAKGLGIILVIIGHCTKTGIFINNWIYSFHMPLFFFISGLCFNNIKYADNNYFIIQRTKTLLIPCIYLSILIYFISFSLNIYPPTDYPPDALWFVFILYLSECFYFFINKYLKNNIIKLSIIFLMLFIGLILNIKRIVLPFCLCSIFPAVFYYGIGNLFKDAFHYYIKKIQLNIYIILLLFLPSVCLCFFGQTINLKENYIPSPEILFVIISFISIFAFLSISTSINNIKGFFLKFKNAILFLGKNTLIILALHMLFINLSLLFIKPFFEIHILYKLIEQLFIWSLLYLSILLINKKCKWLIGK